MKYYPDAERHTMRDKLDVVIRLLDGCSIVHTAALYPNLLPDTHGYTVGKKYARVWTQNWSMPSYCPECRTEQMKDWTVHIDCAHEKVPEMGQRFVAFFVQMDNGDVWKAGGWKQPTLNFTRGNITTPEGRRAITIDKMAPNGYFYAAF